MSHSPSPLRWLRSRFFFPVAGVSILAMTWFVGWHFRGEPWNGPRLPWNLTLAWVPYLCSLGLVWLHQHAPHRRGLWWGLFVVWFAFFPNAPYLVTDWLYLPNFHEDLWYSIGLFLTFSISGLLLSLASLYLVHTLLRTRGGVIETWLVVGLVCLLSGVGVFLGRFVRLNTWDLVTRPGAILEDTLKYVRDPAPHARPLYFSLGFAVLLAVCYFAFVSVRRAPRSREEERAWG